MAILEAIAYAIARGIARAWLEVQMAAKQAEMEVPGDEALRVRTRFRDAVARLCADEGGDSRPQLPPPAS